MVSKMALIKNNDLTGKLILKGLKWHKFEPLQTTYARARSPGFGSIHQLILTYKYTIAQNYFGINHKNRALCGFSTHTKELVWG